MLRGQPRLLRRPPKRLWDDIEPEKLAQTRIMNEPLFDEPREIDEDFKDRKKKIQLLGEKLYMDHTFSPDGTEEPVTVIKVHPQSIIRFRQFGGAIVCYGKDIVDRRFSKKPFLGIVAHNFGNYAYIREVKLTPPSNFVVGQILDASTILQENCTSLMITGKSAGKGFQGTMAKYGFGGGPASHGSSKFHRGRGSIGAGTHISRVLKRTRMAGRGGNKRISIRGVKILAVNALRNLVMVRGSVPGHRKGTLVLTIDDRSHQVLRKG